MADYLFSEFHLGEVLGKRLQKARSEIDGLKEDYLLNASETDLVASLVSKFTVEAPTLGDPFIAASGEANVDVRGNMRYSAGADFFGDNRPMFAKGTRVEIHVPYTGDGYMFRCSPSMQISPGTQADIYDDHLLLTYATPGELDTDQTRRSIERAIEYVRSIVQSVSTDCAKWNDELENQIRQTVVGRKSRLLKSRQAVAGIGLPMKRREDIAKTYTVPTARRKPQIQMPVVKDKAFVPEPALAQEEYEHILSVIKNMVNVMERSPHSFRDMGEEELRTHFLVQLNGQYEGRATGETFNYEGKTDILIRENGRNVLVGECALWKGEAYLTEKINQILGYLHWRDTKAAVIVFNRNKAFSEVLAKVEPTVTKHPCCKKLLKKVGETEWRFLFGNKDDPNREIQLAVLLFDVPKPNA